MSTIYAIGHSTRPLDDFVELLKAHEVTLLADIRTIPRSRHNPQYSRESLEQELPKKGIQYRICLIPHSRNVRKSSTTS